MQYSSPLSSGQEEGAMERRVYVCPTFHMKLEVGGDITYQPKVPVGAQKWWLAWCDSTKRVFESVFPRCQGLCFPEGDPQVPKCSVSPQTIAALEESWWQYKEVPEYGSLMWSHSNAHAQQKVPTRNSRVSGAPSNWGITEWRSVSTRWWTMLSLPNISTWDQHPLVPRRHLEGRKGELDENSEKSAKLSGEKTQFPLIGKLLFIVMFCYSQAGLRAQSDELKFVF